MAQTLKQRVPGVDADGVTTEQAATINETAAKLGNEGPPAYGRRGRNLGVALVGLFIASTLVGCGTDPCETAYDAMWMTKHHADGSKTCVMYGNPGDSAYGTGELPYPG